MKSSVPSSLVQPINFLNVINDDGKNVLILRMRNVPAMDISGLDALEETLAICQKRGMTLLLSHVNAQPYRVLEKSASSRLSVQIISASRRTKPLKKQ